MRGPSNFDSVAAAEEAASHDLAILPGPLFSVSAAFKNFIGVNLSFAWDQERDEKLREMSKLLT